MTLGAKVIELASASVGVREQGGPNRGPEVDAFLRDVGLDPTKGAYSWCAAFVWSTFKRAALELGVPNPLPRRAAVLRLWGDTPAKQRTTVSTSVVPGSVFCIDHGKGKGHCGLVVWVGGKMCQTIEGNTSITGDRNGDGVYQRSRMLDEINLGFILPG